MYALGQRLTLGRGAGCDARIARGNTRRRDVHTRYSTEDALLDQPTLKGAVATAQAEHAGLPRIVQLLANVVHEADFTGAEQVLTYTAHDFRVIAKINERAAGLGRAMGLPLVPIFRCRSGSALLNC